MLSLSPSFTRVGFGSSSPCSAVLGGMPRTLCLCWDSGPREERSPSLLPSFPPRPTSGGPRKERGVPAERACGVGSSEAGASFPFSLRHGVSPEETLGGTFINTDHTVFRGLWQGEPSWPTAVTSGTQTNRTLGSKRKPPWHCRVFTDNLCLGSEWLVLYF